LASKRDSNEREVIPQPEFLLALDGGLELWRTHIEKVVEQQVNAQVMPPEMLERLAETIRRDSRLESLPFVVKRESDRGVYFEMISGHHRLRAARMAGVKLIHVIAETNPLTRSSLVAKQIAHNSITGDPDPEIVAQMFAEIESLDDALEAFVDREQLDTFVDFTPEPTQPDDGNWCMFAMGFLPADMTKFDNLLKRLTGDETLIGAADAAVFTRFQDAIVRVGGARDIRNIGGALLEMADLALKHLDLESEP